MVGRHTGSCWHHCSIFTRSTARRGGCLACYVGPLRALGMLLDHLWCGLCSFVGSGLRESHVFTLSNRPARSTATVAPCECDAAFVRLLRFVLCDADVTLGMGRRGLRHRCRHDVDPRTTVDRTRSTTRRQWRLGWFVGNGRERLGALGFVLRGRPSVGAVGIDVLRGRGERHHCVARDVAAQSSSKSRGRRSLRDLTTASLAAPALIVGVPGNQIVNTSLVDRGQIGIREKDLDIQSEIIQLAQSPSTHGH